MKILVFRHGIAEDRSPMLPDPARQLTRQGYNRTRLAAIGLTRLMRPVDAILTSPYIRAEQTAAILGIAMRRTPQTLHELAADRHPQDAINALFQREDTSVAIVGHNPQLEQIITLLCKHNPSQATAEAAKNMQVPGVTPAAPTTGHGAVPDRALPSMPSPSDKLPRKLTKLSKAGAVLLRAKRYPEKPARLQWAVSPRTLRMLAVRLPRQRPPVPMCVTGIRPEQEDANDNAAAHHGSTPNTPPPSRA